VSRGDISTDVPTIKFSGERLKKLGLPLYPADRWAWFCGDYALYCVFWDQPGYSHYIMIDYDTKVNFSVDDLMSKILSFGYDFVACHAGFERADWMWTAAGRHWFDRVAGCFFPIVVLSRRLLLRCLGHRLIHASSIPENLEERRNFLERRWMNCEAFVPSVALAGDYAMMDIQRLVPGWTYDYMRDVDALYWDMPELADAPCAHPVFLKKDLPQQIQRMLRDIPVSELRARIIERARAVKHSDKSLWRDIQMVNPELDE
jgi:hypothetical protein